MKHEHFHFHYPENWDGIGNGVGSKAEAHVLSRPLHVSEVYKNQYKGDPYKKRADDGPYFPVGDQDSTLESVTVTDKNSRKIQ